MIRWVADTKSISMTLPSQWLQVDEYNPSSSAGPEVNGDFTNKNSEGKGVNTQGLSARASSSSKPVNSRS